MGRGRCPNEARYMTAVEAAYVGAILDTDGCIICHKREHGKAYEHQLRVKLGESELSFELISALIRATGVAHISSYGPSGLGRHPVWIWEVQRQNTVEDIISQVRPYSWKAQFACSHTKEGSNGLG